MGNADVAIPYEDEFIAYIRPAKFSKDYEYNLLNNLRRVIKDLGEIPTDIPKFNDEYLVRMCTGKPKRVQIRIAVRRYLEYRQARYGEKFIDS
jgi:hypothetical protein